MELSQLMAHQQFTVPEDIVAAGEGFVGRMNIDFEVKQPESESQMAKSIR